LTHSEEQFAELEDEAEAEPIDVEAKELDELKLDEPGAVALEVIVLLAGCDVL
jgi:hypothetical protein